MESRLSAYRLSLPQFAALSLLALTTSATAAELARQLMLSPQAGQTLVTRLQAAGHVQPVPAANVGGRAIPMQITEQGRTVLRRAAADVDDVQETFLGVLTASERNRLLESLKKCLPAPRA
jgi:DNA-binding MarR family transcriptional regulator